MKISALKTDVSLADNGAWVDLPGDGDFAGVRLKVRGLGNFDVQRLRRKLEAAVLPEKRTRGVIDPEEQDRIEATLLHECVLLDWRGIEGDDGNPLGYSKEAAGMLLLDRNYAAFRTLVRLAAEVVLDRGRAAIEDDAGN